MRFNEAQNFQRKNGDRDQMTGFPRADHYQSTVGKPVTAIMVIFCILPVLTNGIMAIIRTIFGKGHSTNGGGRFSGGMDDGFASNRRNRNQDW